MTEITLKKYPALAFNIAYVKLHITYVTIGQYYRDDTKAIRLWHKYGGSLYLWNSTHPD